MLPTYPYDVVLLFVMTEKLIVLYRIQLEKPSGDYGSLEEYLHHFPQRVPNPLRSSVSNPQAMEVCVYIL